MTKASTDLTLQEQTQIHHEMRGSNLCFEQYIIDKTKINLKTMFLLLLNFFLTKQLKANFKSLARSISAYQSSDLPTVVCSLNKTSTIGLCSKLRKAMQKKHLGFQYIFKGTQTRFGIKILFFIFFWVYFMAYLSILNDSLNLKFRNQVTIQR